MSKIMTRLSKPVVNPCYLITQAVQVIRRRPILNRIKWLCTHAPECSFKTNGFLLTNGSINEELLQKSYQQRYKNDQIMSQLMVKSLKSCSDYALKQAQLFQWMHTKGECNYYPAILLACITEQVYVNCPATKWRNTSDCTAMRKYLIACDDVESNRK